MGDAAEILATALDQISVLVDSCESEPNHMAATLARIATIALNAIANAEVHFE